MSAIFWREPDDQPEEHYKVPPPVVARIRLRTVILILISFLSGLVTGLFFR
jgi:hypothetical protein